MGYQRKQKMAGDTPWCMVRVHCCPYCQWRSMLNNLLLLRQLLRQLLRVSNGKLLDLPLCYVLWLLLRLHS